MENKINIAEILKDCPQGMELDCTMFNDVVFERIDVGAQVFPIVLRRQKTNTYIYTTKYGHFYDNDDSKCVIFPKGKTTWEDFVPPCKFKDGDIIYTLTENNFKFISIFKKISETLIYSYADLGTQLFLENSDGLCAIDRIISQRFATEEEKQKLFDAVKANGYKWNEETKTLEKLVEPKFKVGDYIRQNKKNIVRLVSEVCDNHYLLDEKDITLPFFAQDDWELVSDKFDITTLKPFDKVLARDYDNTWATGFYSHYETTELSSYYVVNGTGVDQCIPYEGNEHLLGTRDDCDEFYKTWE